MENGHVIDIATFSSVFIYSFTIIIVLLISSGVARLDSDK